MTTTTVKRWSDNALEDYFLDLLVDKHIIDREIQDILDVIEKSALHPDYQILIKRILFWENNLYIEHWWTLASSLIDIVEKVDIRADKVERYGVVLGMMLRVIETVFDVEDDMFGDFVICEEKEDIEHELIILMKRILDFIENALREMLTHSEHLDGPIDDHVRDEYNIIKTALLRYPTEILESQNDIISTLKIQIDTIIAKLTLRRKELKRLGR